MPKSQIAQQMIDLSTHPTIRFVLEIRPYNYTIVYCCQNRASLYANQVFNLRVTLDNTYPEVPPTLKFMENIYHLNVNQKTGKVQMSILKEDVFSSLDEILQQPDINCPADTSLLQLYTKNFSAYETKAKDKSKKLVSDSIIEVLKSQKGQKSVQGHQVSKQEFENNSSVASPQASTPIQFQTFANSKQPNKIFLTNKNEEQHIDNFVVKEQSIKSFYSSFNYDEEIKRLKRANESVELFSKDCINLQKIISNTENKRIKSFGQAKLDQQWKMLEELIEISHQMKRQLVEFLKKHKNGKED